jgi:phosphatidylinositol-3-phosphatase
MTCLPNVSRRLAQLITDMRVALVAVASAATALACEKVVTPTVPPPPGSSQLNHVFIVAEENADYTNVIGSSSMPYLNRLAQQYGLATQYYADTHPSIGNYFMMTVGDTITNNDSYSRPLVTEDNVVRELRKAGKTWRSYAEDLPYAGYTGPDVGNYARKHNTLALVADVVNDSAQVKNLVPFAQLATDLASNTLPNYAFIVPNLCNDAHDCPLSTADGWLKTNIDPLITSAQFQRDAVLIILFDESGGDNTNGGGRVAWVIVSAKAKRGYQSTTLYRHESTLRLSLSMLGVTGFPNRAASAPAMTEFFTP